MISKEELNPKGCELTPDQSTNLDLLHERINKVRKEYAKPMYVSSGFRSQADHRRIYKEKATRQGLKTFKIPMGSQHLKGSAVDISDPTGELKVWLKNNIKVLEDTGLWCEDFDYTSTWVHFQTSPPKSNKRFFIP